MFLCTYIRQKKLLKTDATEIDSQFQIQEKYLLFLIQNYKSTINKI